MLRFLKNLRKKKSRKPEKYHYYFAYGSNMLEQQLEKRVGRIELTGKANLPAHNLVFNANGKAQSYANIEKSVVRQHIVEGVVYKLTARQLAKLDKYEVLYDKIFVYVYPPNSSKMIFCVTYKCHFNLYPDNLPTKDYMWKLIRGAELHELSSNYINRLKNIKIK